MKPDDCLGDVDDLDDIDRVAVGRPEHSREASQVQRRGGIGGGHLPIPRQRAQNMEFLLGRHRPGACPLQPVMERRWCHRQQVVGTALWLGLSGADARRHQQSTHTQGE